MVALPTEFKDFEVAQRARARACPKDFAAAQWKRATQAAGPDALVGQTLVGRGLAEGGLSTAGKCARGQ
eukprot:8901940-Pyramimonas_sp.AAC.1